MFDCLLSEQNLVLGYLGLSVRLRTPFNSTFFKMQIFAVFSRIKISYERKKKDPRKTKLPPPRTGFLESILHTPLTSQTPNLPLPQSPKSKFLFPASTTNLHSKKVEYFFFLFFAMLPFSFSMLDHPCTTVPGILQYAFSSLSLFVQNHLHFHNPHINVTTFFTNHR